MPQLLPGEQFSPANHTSATPAFCVPALAGARTCRRRGMPAHGTSGGLSLVALRTCPLCTRPTSARASMGVLISAQPRRLHRGKSESTCGLPSALGLQRTGSRRSRRRGRAKTGCLRQARRTGSRFAVETPEFEVRAGLQKVASFRMSLRRTCRSTPRHVWWPRQASAEDDPDSDTCAQGRPERTFCMTSRSRRMSCATRQVGDVPPRHGCDLAP